MCERNMRMSHKIFSKLTKLTPHRNFAKVGWLFQVFPIESKGNMTQEKINNQEKIWTKTLNIGKSEF